MRGDKKPAIEKLARDGYTDATIARKVECSLSYVRFVRGQLGIYRKPGQVKNTVVGKAT